MKTAKIFENGRSQAVRLPKEYRLNGDDVYINKIGNTIMLTPKGYEWDLMVKSLEMFSEDFMEDGRSVDTEGKREDL